jgi:polyhydroxyalkanoate synthesis regulator phasin
MAWTAAEEDRIQAIEKQINKIQIALTNLATTVQVRTLNVIKQKEIDELQTRVTALEAQVAILQNNV